MIIRVDEEGKQFMSAMFTKVLASGTVKPDELVPLAVAQEAVKLIEESVEDEE